MKRYFILITILFASLAASAQDYDLAIADIDLDGKADIVRIEKNEGVVICKLSSRDFKPQTTRPMEALTRYGYSTLISLSADPGRFLIGFLGNRASSHYLFVYDKKKKNIYLSEVWSEQLGDINGNEASYFEHDVLRGRVYYSIRYYEGPMYAEEYDENAYHTDTVKKRVAKLHIPLEEFTVEDYSKKTDYIWEELE